MKIGIYSDLHCSKSSSILSGSTNTKYSQRLDLIVETFKWMYDLFDKEGVELIINGGDTFDSDIILAVENSAMAEALSYTKGTPEYHLLGNHEKSTRSNVLHSVALLDNYDHINIVTEPTVLDYNGIALLPYTNDYDNYEVFKTLSENGGKYLVTHADYIGMKYDTGKESTYGFSPDIALDYFSRIFNGHIHSASSNYNDRLVNIGSVLGSGFGNSYRESYPSIIIFDTDTNTYKRYVNPHSPLFLNRSAKTVSDIIDILSKLDTNKLYCLKLEVPYELRDDARQLLNNFREKNEGVLLADRVHGVIDHSEVLINNKEVIENLNNYANGAEALEAYVNCTDDLPCKLNEMIDFINKYYK